MPVDSEPERARWAVLRLAAVAASHDSIRHDEIQPRKANPVSWVRSARLTRPSTATGAHLPSGASSSATSAFSALASPATPPWRCHGTARAARRSEAWRSCEHSHRHTHAARGHLVQATAALARKPRLALGARGTPQHTLAASAAWAAPSTRLTLSRRSGWTCSVKRMSATYISTSDDAGMSPCSSATCGGFVSAACFQGRGGWCLLYD